MTIGIFKSVYNVEPSQFKTVTAVDAFIRKVSGQSLMPSNTHGQNFVLPSGNVFNLTPKIPDKEVDVALDHQEWLTRLLKR